MQEGDGVFGRDVALAAALLEPVVEVLGGVVRQRVAERQAGVDAGPEGPRVKSAAAARRLLGRRLPRDIAEVGVATVFTNRAQRVGAVRATTALISPARRRWCNRGSGCSATTSSSVRRFSVLLGPAARVAGSETGGTTDIVGLLTVPPRRFARMPALGGGRRCR